MITFLSFRRNYFLRLFGIVLLRIALIVLAFPRQGQREQLAIHPKQGMNLLLCCRQGTLQVIFQSFALLPLTQQRLLRHTVDSRGDMYDRQLP